MMPLVAALPIDEVLPAVIAALHRSRSAVLVAPPGAGKTTRVPLVLAQEAWARGRTILVLEPRRLAARAAASRMAATLGEPVGATVGYRARLGSKVSAATRIEVVTEGIFTRRVLDDPSLKGIAAVLFDEIHERSLEADLGLALALDVQSGLREDLRLLAMSATLDGARVARLLGGPAGAAPVIESAGRAFPVETRYLGRTPREPIERQAADAVIRALRAEAGSMLVFLPGAAEIGRTERILRERLDDPAVDVVPLHGALDADAQDRAIAAPAAGRRKVVLATSIAETSLTIEGVRIVVDAGLARVPRYEPDVGLTRLETVRVSRAAADQRRGRAGRTAPGICYRLWEEAQTASLAAADQPAILAADLSGLVLDLAHWGVRDPAQLSFLDLPPPAALAEAKALLADIGAVDDDGQITEAGRRLRELPLPPRVARMVLAATAQGEAARAVEIAVLLTERGLGGNEVDLEQRLDTWRRDGSRRARDARELAKGWLDTAGRAGVAEQAGSIGPLSAGALLALAYPDRIARNRGDEGAFLLANGRGAAVDPASVLARAPFLAIAEISGSAAQGRIVLAAPLTLAEIEALFSSRIEAREEVVFDAASASLRGRRRRRLFAITLSEEPMRLEPTGTTARRLAEGIARLGIDRLPWTSSLRQWRDRVMFLRRTAGGAGPGGEAWPDLSDESLAASATEWLAPALARTTSLAGLSGADLAQALQALVPWRLRRQLDSEAPPHFEAPSGFAVPIDYAAPEGPRLAIRVQELFGLDRHPAVAGGRVPLVLELLSPAQRPVQVTRDLPGFWRGSYADVRAEMKGRYPRHPWPDDPLSAPPTRRARSRRP
jgi:ATP-dependent helicase HrpB